MTRCPLGFDADAVVEALRASSREPSANALIEHVRECEECGRVAETWTLMRAGWKADAARDDQFARLASEIRLALPQPERGVVTWPVAVALAIAALVVGAWLGRGPYLGAKGRAPVASLASSGPPFASLSAPASSAVETAVVAPPPEAQGGARDLAAGGLVAVRSCAACSGGVRAGSRIEGGIDVPRSTTLRLNWALSAAIVDAASSVDVVGPARVSTTQDGDGNGAGLMLERGSATAVVTGRRAIFTAQARTAAVDSEWTVRVDAGITHVAVAKGEVEVRTAQDRTRLRAGQKLDVAPDGHFVAAVASRALEASAVGSQDVAMHAPAPQPGATSSGSSLEQSSPAKAPPTARAADVLRSATSSLGAGDAEGARVLLEGLLTPEQDPAMRDRASFLLAEIDLGHGRAPDGRRRLEALVTARDPSLAGDAVFLLARATPLASERASVLARYAATLPPSPYREQAQVELARALLEGGDAKQARGVVAALRAHGPVPSVVAPALAALERTLAASTSTPR